MVAASGCAPPMPPRPAGHHQPPGQAAAEVLAGALGEGLVGALQDALRADVDPGAGGHLAVHGQAQRFEPAELVPGGPARHQVGVGDQHPRRLVVGAEHADRLAALDQQRLVVLQPAQRGDDALVALPVARRLAAAAVDDQVLGALGHLGVEVVHQHPQGGLLVPALAGQAVPVGALMVCSWDAEIGHGRTRRRKMSSERSEEPAERAKGSLDGPGEILRSRSLPERSEGLPRRRSG